jgi:hypothetical protein
MDLVPVSLTLVALFVARVVCIAIFFSIEMRLFALVMVRLVIFRPFSEPLLISFIVRIANRCAHVAAGDLDLVAPALVRLRRCCCRIASTMAQSSCFLFFIKSSSVLRRLDGPAVQSDAEH